MNNIIIITEALKHYELRILFIIYNFSAHDTILVS